MVAILKSGIGASRAGVVQQLRARGASGADELAEALGVTKQCVRKHLDVLEREGYVEHAQARGDRGRPAHVFRLTPKAEELFPKRYDLFAKSVLRQVGEVWGERGLNAVFCGCATETVGELRPQLEGVCF
ncbi:MAG TPA: HTH domain-containing protein, partial [Pyrinomonadaceae bacterium]